MSKDFSVVKETLAEFREYKESKKEEATNDDKWQKGKIMITDNSMLIIKPKAKFDLNSMVISFMESKDGTITLNLPGVLYFFIYLFIQNIFFSKYYFSFFLFLLCCIKLFRIEFHFS